MNRHGYHNEHEYEEGGNAEMPLPTYEEVVGATNHNIGFKGDLLMPPRQGGRACGSGELPRQRADLPNCEEARTPSYYDSRRKCCAKSYIVGITGVVLIPLLILLIVLQLQSCNSCEHMDKVDKTIKVDPYDEYDPTKLNECNSELQKVSGRYSNIFSELQIVKKEREMLLKKGATAEEEFQNLRYNYNTAFSDATNLRAEANRLKKEIEEYKSLVKELRGDLQKP